MHQSVFFLIICLLALLSLPAFANDTEAFPSLIDQLNGQRCDYEFVGVCQKREVGFLESIGIRSIRNKNEQCVLWSIQCLGSMKPPEAIPALIGALESQPNVQTCDGVIPLRYMIIKELAEIGDKRAVPALEKYIKTNTYERLSDGAVGCAAEPESKQPAKEALVRILGNSYNRNE